MRYHYLLSFVLSIAIFLTLGCEEAVVTGGKVQFPPNANAQVNNAVGTRTHGYSELKFSLTDNSDTFRKIGLLVRTIDEENYYGCGILYNGPGDTSARIELAISGTQESVFRVNIPDLAVGDHTLGCNLVSSEGSDQLKLYLNGTLLGSYSIGTHENDSVIPSGKVGFMGLSDDGDASASKFAFYGSKP
jgi:hypothetical protein